MLRFASLGSGSKGNGTLVEGGGTCVLIDCGFSVRETERRLARLGRHPGDISAILVTHEHGDHLRGALPLARKHRLPVMMTPGTARGARLGAGEGLISIRPQQAFKVGDLQVMPVAVPHDAGEPVQFTVAFGGRKLGVLTDLGSITDTVVQHFDGCDGLLLEANHDVQMLYTGRYPPSLKQRVGGNWGHLNNGQAADLLSLIERRRIQALVLGHISQQNNRPQRVAEAVAPWVEGMERVIYACQDEGFSWQQIN